MAIVPRPVWVIANFKEAQLARMRAGDPVAIRVKAYPRHIFAGRVESIQAGASARLSLVPPPNAAGNPVKAARRVPVKILFDDAGLAQAGLPLGPGMSVEAEVKVK
jgi:membrane fusion protein (multidrug efflux system)